MSEEDKTQERTPEEIAAAVAKAKAESRKAEAEAEQALAEARKANSEAVVLEIEQAKKEREERDELAKDRYHHIINFHSSVEASSVNNAIDTMNKWIRQSEQCEDGPITITMDIDSPGGGILEGFRLFNKIKEFQGRGHTINTHISGMAASMAGVLSQAGDLRTAGQYSQVLIHRASFGIAGGADEISDQLKWVESMEEMIIRIYVERSQDEDGKPRLTRNKIRKGWDRKDWWLPAEQCLENGIIDNIL